MQSSQCEVLIVGAGPVGMTLANLLGRYGVSALVIDKAAAILTHPRAIALDNEALRILQLAGLGEQAFAKVAIPCVHMRSPYAGEFARINTAGCLDGHPKLVNFYQPELEQALADALQHYPQIRLQRQTELLGFQQNATGVTAQLRGADQSEQSLSCRYLIGADGASSVVRQLLGLNFKGSTYGEDWLVVDALHVPQPIDRIEFICDPKRPVPHMVAPGQRERWEFMLHPGESREAMLQPDKLRELLAPWVPAAQLELERSAVYRFHARVVERFQLGRVFLVGDAAHLTPPFVGQGLCAGLRDVANLGWKLAWVLQDRASPAILDSYDQERRPHAAAMIRLAKWMGRLVMPRNPLQAVLSHGLVRLLRLLPATRALLDDLKIKPQNRFRHGLFQPGKDHSRLQRGGHFAQALLRNDAGEIQLSDDVLGNKLCLVGFGIDPHSLLDSGELARWRAAGGHCVQICQRGQSLHRQPGQHVWEDISGAFVGELAPFAWLAVVRPDRTLLHDGPATSASQLLDTSLNLLGSPQPHATACLAPE